MSIVGDILTILSSYGGGCRLMRRRLLGDTRTMSAYSLGRCSDETFRVTLSRLKSKGFIKNEGELWFITESGRSFFSKKLPQINFAGSAAIRNQRKSMIIAFDIPHERRRARAWLRRRLGGLGFVMMQKSVWLGPGPLPREFIQALGDAHILKYMKFFRAEEWSLV